MANLSPFAPVQFPDLPAVSGLRLATATCGIRYVGRTDLLLMEFAPGTQAAGLFTRSKTASAPVDWCKQALAKSGGRARALVVNSGNANAFTGRAGARSVHDVATAAARLMDCPSDRIYLASTGVIGEVLPHQKIVSALAGLRAQPGDDWETAAGAIMTTDTYPKGSVRSCQLGETPITLVGVAKGAGMIAPDMATMLCFVATDATIPAPILQSLLAPAVDKTFNCITIDGDTSTSDTVLAFATGRAKNARPETVKDPALGPFKKALTSLLEDLAVQVVKDGEGLSKFVTIDVLGATSKAAARKIGLSVANSPLVKTAIAGEDANWGRIVMAVGKSGQRVDRDRLRIAIGGHPIAEHGQAVAGYDEAPVAAHMRGREIELALDIGVGRGRARVWTCDLTHGYIDINADYRS